MPIVKQLKVTLRGRPGALAQLCTELAKHAVNIHAIHAASAQATRTVRLFTDRLDVARQVCAALELPCANEEVLALRIAHRPGSLGRVTRKIAKKGIKIDYLYGTIETDSRRALIIVGVSDLAAAARIAH